MFLSYRKGLYILCPLYFTLSIDCCARYGCLLLWNAYTHIRTHAHARAHRGCGPASVRQQWSRRALLQWHPRWHGMICYGDYMIVWWNKNCAYCSVRWFLRAIQPLSVSIPLSLCLLLCSSLYLCLSVLSICLSVSTSICANSTQAALRTAAVHATAVPGHLCLPSTAHVVFLGPDCCSLICDF